MTTYKLVFKCEINAPLSNSFFGRPDRVFMPYDRAYEFEDELTDFITDTWPNGTDVNVKIMKAEVKEV